MGIKKMWDKLINGSGDEKETEFLPAILEVTETPPSPVGRMVMWTILLLIVCGLLWSCIGTINEVAVATGKVIPNGQVKTIQSKNKGIIKNIYVTEGQFVKAGDVLVEMDPTTSSADLDSLKKRAAYLQLDIERLTAELSGEPFNPVKTPELTDRDIAAQISLYTSRRSQHEAERNAAEMAVRQKQSALQSEQIGYEKYAGVTEISQEKERRLRQLVEQNAIAEFQLLEQVAKNIEYTKLTEAQLDVIAKAQAELAEANERLANVDAAYQKDIMTSLVESRKDYYAFEEEIKKAEEDSRMATIVAPVDGRVNELAVHTIGGIVTDAQSLMSIVPEGTEMELEVWADNKDIGFIKIDQIAEVKIDTFNFQKFGVVEAVVAEISPDAFTDNRDLERDKKFRLLLTLNKESVQVHDEEVGLMPGMNVTAEIKIREKKIIDFFLDPFRKYTSEALRER